MCIKHHFNNKISSRLYIIIAIILLQATSVFAQKDGDIRSVSSGYWSNAAAATAVAKISGGVVTKIIITGASSGYTALPVVTINGTGTGATATAVLTNGSVTAINVTNGGSGYTAATTVTIAGLNKPVSVWEEYHEGYSSVWKLRSAEEIGADSINMRKPGYSANAWVNAIVPGTVFGSYVVAGIEPDPNFGDNIYKVDKTKYERDYWYRTEFGIPSTYTGQKIWLNFNGINKVAEIYLNNVRIGTQKGMMLRGKYDITDKLSKTGTNILAILVHVLHGPLNDFGSPTYMSSAGWDWMPAVPGLNIGITDKVFLSTSGAVSMIDPWIRTKEIISPSSAKIALALTLKNNTDTTQTGVLTGIINPGNIQFTKKVSVNAKANLALTLNDTTLNNIKLWWPNGYGDPNLYTLKLKYTVGGKVSDSTAITFGIRKYTYSYSNEGNFKNTDGRGVLQISINGTRVFLKGGNWGMSEYMLRCRDSDYQTRIRLHKEMNFNMIRNWLGSTTDNEFYDNCDKYGIMVWDDFWLNNQFTFLNDEKAFFANLPEKVKRFRNYACVAVWCGDNESVAYQDANMRDTTNKYDQGDRMYLPSSNQGGLSGSGVWFNQQPKSYFGDQYRSSLTVDQQLNQKDNNGKPNPVSKLGFVGNWGLRTELGTGVFPNIESFKKFMPAANLWPRNAMWDKHFFSDDFTIGGGASPSGYVNSINNSYGAATGAEDFCRKAQLLNIETNKAMFEGWQDHLWSDASGLLLWMSQSAYPSMIWQTYDYYYDLTGAYFGAKKACEPVHIQWNSATNSIKVINTSLADLNNVTATSTIYNKDGNPAPNNTQTATVSVPSNTNKECFVLNVNTTGLSDVYFLKLSLKDGSGKILSDNFYWIGSTYGNYKGLNTLQQCPLTFTSAESLLSNGKAMITCNFTNPITAPNAAFGIRVKLVNSSTNEQILPAIFDDNYFSLMREESKTIHIEYNPALLAGGTAKITFEQYNPVAADTLLHAKVFKVAGVLQNNMVIQRDKPFQVWGTATPNYRITVKASWNNAAQSAITDNTGNWKLAIPAAPVNEVAQTLVSYINGLAPITLNNLLIGDVWFCSGQSNMVMPVDSVGPWFGYEGVVNRQAEIAAANYPYIRVTTVNYNGQNAPMANLNNPTPWVVCSPKTVGTFGAVAYFFGRKLHTELNVPVGLVIDAAGGTACEAWTSKETIAGNPTLSSYYTGRNGATALYNGMVYPYRNLSVKGFVWYQGETNRHDMPESNYTELNSALIANWRALFNQGNLPFYFVQMTPFAEDFFTSNPWGGDPLLVDYAKFRVAQANIQAVPNTGMAITMDVGDSFRIHPRDKKPIGERLALLALQGAYSQDVQALGPQFASYTTTGNTATINFVTGTANLLTTKDNKPLNQYFFVAGADKVFKKGTAVIIGNKIIVTAPAGFTLPIQAVRYAFTNFPVTNLQNSAGLPAEPFRTDNWDN